MKPRTKENRASESAESTEHRELTPHDRAERDGEEELSLHRWTDSELRQRAQELGVAGAETLSRQKLIDQLSDR
jgi:hypothetical protein